MAKYFIVVLALLVSSSECTVSRRGNSKLQFSEVRKVNITSTLNTKFDGKGLKPWYDIAKSFIHTVQGDDLPYEDIRKIKDNDNFKWQEFLKGWELPFLATFAIGFLFAIIVPIVGFCFCCCRCCGNCGGEMVQKQTNKDGLKRTVFTVLLVIITLLLFTGCLLAFVSNDRISDTVQSYKTTPIRAIRDSETYFNETLNIVTGNVIQNVVDVLRLILEDVVVLPKRIADGVTDELRTKVRDPLESVVRLANNTKKMETLLQNIDSTTVELQSRFQQLNSDLANISRELNATCSASGSLCSDIDYQAALKTNANFSSLPNVTAELKNISYVLNKNKLLESAEKGLREFDTIDENIQNKTRNSTQEITKEVKKANDTFVKSVQKDIVDKVNEVILSKTDGWIKDINKAFKDQVDPYDRYRYYAGVGLTSLILLPVVLIAMGLLCGIFGHDKDALPTERRTISHMGGNCLMAGVGFMFIFVFFLMLFTAVCFILGAHLEKGCDSVREETLYSKFLDVPRYWDNKYILANSIYGNGSIVLTISGVLSSCRKNEAIYQAIQGDNKWNLTETIGVKEKLGNIEKNLDDFNVGVTDQTVLDNNTKDGLTNLGNSGVGSINFEKFLNETSKDVVNSTAMNQLISNLRSKNNTSLNGTADRLEAIQNQANDMQKRSRELGKNVRELRSLGQNITAVADETLNGARVAERQFLNQVGSVVFRQVKDLAKGILDIIQQTSDWAVNVVRNDIGPCKILADIYDAAVNLLCRETVYPFNGFWFSIGFCLFFYIPAIILSVKLAKYYRRMRFEEGFDRHDGMEMSDVAGRNKPWLTQGNSVYPR